MRSNQLMQKLEATTYKKGTRNEENVPVNIHRNGDYRRRIYIYAVGTYGLYLCTFYTYALGRMSVL